MEGSTLGQVLHGSATTTEAIRRAIQNSEALSLKILFVVRTPTIRLIAMAAWAEERSASNLRSLLTVRCFHRRAKRTSHQDWPPRKPKRVKRKPRMPQVHGATLDLQIRSGQRRGFAKKCLNDWRTKQPEHKSSVEILIMSSSIRVNLGCMQK